jgi:hypothetical protein
MALGDAIFFFAFFCEVFVVSGCYIGECDDFRPHSAQVEFFQLFVGVAVICKGLH